MTMQFQLEDAGLAAGFKPGDSVRFAFQKRGDDFVIQLLQRAEVRP
jgi:Cu/Ag efflux protein CusF